MCDEEDFERRFRVPHSVFLRIYDAVNDRQFFVQRTNATGSPQAHTLQKVVAAFRVIVFGDAPDRTDEYVHLPASTISVSVRELLHFIVDAFDPSYLRLPVTAELQRILERNEQRGLPGCMRSLDCSRLEWSNCPTAFAGMYQKYHGKRVVVAPDYWYELLGRISHLDQPGLEVHPVEFTGILVADAWNPTWIFYPISNDCGLYIIMLYLDFLRGSQTDISPPPDFLGRCMIGWFYFHCFAWLRGFFWGFLGAFEGICGGDREASWPRLARQVETVWPQHFLFVLWVGRQPIHT